MIENLLSFKNPSTSDIKSPPGIKSKDNFRIYKHKEHSNAHKTGVVSINITNLPKMNMGYGEILQFLPFEFEYLEFDINVYTDVWAKT